MYLPWGDEEYASRRDWVAVEIHIMGTAAGLEPYNLIESVHMHRIGLHSLELPEELRHMVQLQPHSRGVVAHHIIAAEDLFQVIHIESSHFCKYANSNGKYETHESN